MIGQYTNLITNDRPVYILIDLGMPVWRNFFYRHYKNVQFMLHFYSYSNKNLQQAYNVILDGGKGHIVFLKSR